MSKNTKIFNINFQMKIKLLYKVFSFSMLHNKTL
jgi:hypothetical protein